MNIKKKKRENGMVMLNVQAGIKKLKHLIYYYSPVLKFMNKVICTQQLNNLRIKPDEIVILEEGDFVDELAPLRMKLKAHNQPMMLKVYFNF